MYLTTEFKSWRPLGPLPPVLVCGPKPWDEEDGIGVLHCCGKQLDWRRERGSRVLEAECGECGTRYLMGNDGGLDEVREFAM